MLLKMNTILLSLLVINLHQIQSISTFWSCSDFSEGACDLSENNIVGTDRHSDTPSKCQTLCQQNPSCSWFTHFDSQCYLLRECGNTEFCGGCTSGPQEPDVSTCPWPPNPDTTTTTTMKPTTTTTTKRTTTTRRTTTTTAPPPPPATTTTPSASCNEIVKDELCDWQYGKLAEYKNIWTGAECQALCRAVNGAVYFSHYNKGDDFRNDYEGHCGCFSTCPWPGSFSCHRNCDDDVRNSHKCHCMRGLLQPDVTSCT